MYMLYCCAKRETTAISSIRTRNRIRTNIHFLQSQVELCLYCAFCSAQYGMGMELCRSHVTACMTSYRRSISLHAFRLFWPYGYQLMLKTCHFAIQDKRISRSHGYSLKGRRTQIKRRHSPWGPRITAILVICIEDLLDVGLYRGHVNKETFLEFVNNILVPCLLPFNGVNPRSVVILGKVFCVVYDCYFVH